MPLYLSTLQPGRSTESQRAQIADCVTKVHVDVTGAPVQFVNTFFSEQPDEEGGFEPLPPGKVIFVNGNIRSGRNNAAKAEMIERITAGAVEAIGCKPEEVGITLRSAPAAHGMEGGKILPAPGTPEEEAWKKNSPQQRPPILFVHGMFMNSSSWSGWEEYFSQRGHATYAPDWPYRDGDPEQLKVAPPEELPSLRLAAVLDVYRRAIARMPEPPILVGHSMGGLIVQILLQEGGVRAGVAIDSVPPAGISSFKWSFVRSNVPVIVKRRRPFVPSKSWFTYAFAHTLDDAAAEQVWRDYAVPESGQVARDSTSDVAKIDPKADRPPLLLVAGELDHIIPASLARKNHKFYQGPPTDYQEFAGRTHWICGQEGWEEVAQYVNSWLETAVGQ